MYHKCEIHTTKQRPEHRPSYIRKYNYNNFNNFNINEAYPGMFLPIRRGGVFTF